MALSADSPPPMPVVPSLSPEIGVASLYQEIILSHYRSPRHRGVLEGASVAIEHRNPLCGDVMSVQLALDNHRIVDAAFTARACSITQATASMLLVRLIGASVDDARMVLAQIEQLLDGSSAADPTDREQLGDLRALASVARFPARKACVRLVTAAVNQALEPR